MRPSVQTVCRTTASFENPVAFRIAVAGSHDDADRTKAVWESFSTVKTLYSRVEPLCDHQRKALRQHHIPRFATLYAKMYPDKVPTPKMHAICAHVTDQADACGSVGQFGESVIEAAHVADNGFRRRFSAVTDLEKNLMLRYRAYCHAANSTIANLHSEQHAQSASKRRKRNHGSRRAKHAL